MSEDEATSLKGQILLAMPGIEDSRFNRSVIYICEHSPHGAMGIILNRAMKNVSFINVLEQVELLDENENFQLSDDIKNNIVVHKGGPVETGRGFVLHTADYHIGQSTHRIDDKVSLTETLEILKALARGDGPAHAFLALGYAGWAGGQLESEIQRNGWLHSDASIDLVFGEDLDAKYDHALSRLGIDPALLSTTSGHA